MPLTNELVSAAWRSPSASWALGLKAGPNHFDICGNQGYVSIKDQIIRAKTLVRWLIDTGVVGTHTQRILVVGAGVAGVSAATSLVDWTHNRYNFEVDLIDRDSAPFGTQRGCSSRMLSLTQYDWPAPHSASHNYPSALTNYLGRGPRRLGDGIVTQAHADTPDALANQWAIQLAAYCAACPRLNTMYQHSMQTPPTLSKAGNLVDVKLQDHLWGTSDDRQYDIVISATGFGKERIPQWPGQAGFVTPHFWQNDSVANAHYAHGQNVAIVGLGDGSLQDFIRLVCDPALNTAHAVVDQMRAKFVAGGGNPADWDAMLAQLTAIDRQATLALPWAADAYPVWQRAHDTCRGQVLRLLFVNPVAAWNAVGSVLRQNLPRRIVFFSISRAPTKVYLLNRFLYIALGWRSNKLVQQHYGSAALDANSSPGHVHINVTTQAGHVVQVGPFEHVIWRMGPAPNSNAAAQGSVRDSLGKVALAYAPPH